MRKALYVILPLLIVLDILLAILICQNITPYPYRSWGYIGDYAGKSHHMVKIDSHGDNSVKWRGPGTYYVSIEFGCLETYIGISGVEDVSFGSLPNAMYGKGYEGGSPTNTIISFHLDEPTTVHLIKLSEGGIPYTEGSISFGSDEYTDTPISWHDDYGYLPWIRGDTIPEAVLQAVEAQFPEHDEDVQRQVGNGSVSWTYIEPQYGAIGHFGTVYVSETDEYLVFSYHHNSWKDGLYKIKYSDGNIEYIFND